MLTDGKGNIPTDKSQNTLRGGFDAVIEALKVLDTIENNGAKISLSIRGIDREAPISLMSQLESNMSSDTIDNLYILAHELEDYLTSINDNLINIFNRI